jgi:hypothetical protein
MSSELNLIVLQPASSGGGGTGSGITEAQKKILIRIGGQLTTNAPININSPAAGWVEHGTDLTFADNQEFLAYTQVYRNGQLLYVAEYGGPETADAYASVSGPLVELYSDPGVVTNDVFVIWKFTKTP